MLYLKLPVSQQCVILGYEDRDHQFFKQYMEIRDFHYVHKNSWEPEGGEDQYDQYSKFLVVVSEGMVLAGCRIIQDIIGLSVREVLRKHDLPPGQIPKGSTEVSRFGIHPEVLKNKGAIECLKCLSLGLETYFQLFGITTSYAELRGTLEVMLSRLGVIIKRLPHGAVTQHGEDVFYTVSLHARQSQSQTANFVERRKLARGGC